MRYIKTLLCMMLIISNSSCNKNDYVAGSVKTSEITNINSNSAFGGGKIKIDFEGKAVNVEIEEQGLLWAIKENELEVIFVQNDYETSAQLFCTKEKSDNFSCTLNGLKPKTKYYVKAFAIINRSYKNENFDKYIVYGNLKEFETLSNENELGYIKDAGLIVQTYDVSESAVNWKSANDLCNNSPIGGDSMKWRLPTIQELSAIYGNSKLKVNFKNAEYWSSDNAFGDYYYVFDMTTGNQDEVKKSENRYVRCVCEEK